MKDFLDSFSGSGNFRDNSSLSCAESSLLLKDNTSISSSTANAANIIQITYGTLLIFLGVIFNGLIVILVLRNKNLWTPTFFISFQICLNDILLAFAFGLPMIFYSAPGKLNLGSEFCFVHGFISSVCVINRIVLVSVFAMDLFGYIFTPFQYRKYNNKISIMLSIICWGIVILMGLVGVPLDCYRFHESINICFFSSDCNSCVYLSLTVLLVLFPTSVVTIVIFISVYIKVKKLRKEDLRNRKTRTTDILSQELKALKAFVGLFTVMFFLTFPSIVIAFILNRFLEENSKGLVNQILFNVNIVYIFLDSFIVMSNKNIERELKKKKDFLKKLCCQRSFIIRRAQ